MTGGTLPAGPVMLKVSVAHWVADEMATPAVIELLPPISLPVDRVIVFGPASTKELKSMRI